MKFGQIIKEHMAMKSIVYLSAFFLLVIVPGTSAQDKETILAEGDSREIFEKKFRWGISYHQYWSTITGDNLPKNYFLKPSLGFNIRAEYYFNSFLGIGAGFGVQQRGAGVINQDNYGGSFSHPWIKPNGDIDSTYTQKLRFNTLEVPLTLLLRTPKNVIKGVRLSAAAGIIYIHNYQTNDVWVDVGTGNHLDNFVTDDYTRNDLGYQISFGPEINAGESNLIQVHFVYTQGTKNIYAVGQGEGRQVTLGVRVAWLF